MAEKRPVPSSNDRTVKKGKYQPAASGHARDMFDGSGILVTSQPGKEKNSRREAFHILDKYYNQFHTDSVNDQDKENATNDVRKVDDLEAAIAAEIDDFKERKPKERRWRWIDIGVRGIQYIKGPENLEPTAFIHRTLTEIKNTRYIESRFIMRFIPIQLVCSGEEVEKGVKELIDTHFKSFPHLDPAARREFGLEYKKSNHTGHLHDKVLDAIKREMQGLNKENTLNFRSTEFVFYVHAIKGWLCMTILTDYTNLAKYNMQSLSDMVRASSSPTASKGTVRNLVTVNDKQQQ
eukprot:Clim_evm4s146 gene=Clim_evmTU4s146